MALASATTLHTGGSAHFSPQWFRGAQQSFPEGVARSPVGRAAHPARQDKRKRRRAGRRREGRKEGRERGRRLDNKRSTREGEGRQKDKKSKKKRKKRKKKKKQKRKKRKCLSVKILVLMMHLAPFCGFREHTLGRCARGNQQRARITPT